MATNYKESLSRIQPHTWKIAFIFAFLALLVDGADLMLLSYSLNSIKADFGLSSVQAGMLGSFTLAGMAVGGIFGGWACDKFGRVRIVVISILIFSLHLWLRFYSELSSIRYFKIFCITWARLALHCL
jgi:AAHS family cis,cis-muconate transporter-like MFS transporter